MKKGLQLGKGSSPLQTGLDAEVITVAAIELQLRSRDHSEQVKPEAKHTTTGGTVLWREGTESRGEARGRAEMQNVEYGRREKRRTRDTRGRSRAAVDENEK